MTLLTGGALTHTPSCPQQLQACAQLMQGCVEPAGAPPKKILSMPVDGRTVLREIYEEGRRGGRLEEEDKNQRMVEKTIR